uniref:Phosphatidic acid phosphatase type 2/haloperoxidase domain-containing protein n=1 Tax=Colobus angolensis palliatus TaxID=336983 RepID=A0A2K5IX20_COLAP
SLPFAILTLVNAPYKRGFYCADDSIRYPYRPDTITHGLMAGVTTTATIVLVSAGEAYLVYTDRLYSRSDFNNYVAAVYKVLGAFLFGAAVSQSLTDLAKYMIGRLRPNFLAVCDPDWSRINCSVYVQLEKVCRGNPANVTEAVRYISDFFKVRPPQHCPQEEELERKPSLSLTLTLSEADHNHYGYPHSSP